MLLAVVVAAAACADSDPQPDIELDGSARPPDDGGVVTEVDRDGLVLDEGERRPLSRHLLAFSTYTLSLQPVASMEGRYVHVGLEDGVVTWIALISAPLETEGRMVAHYTGRLEQVDGAQARFADGTVLLLGDEVDAPPEGASVLARIDVASDEVVELGRG